MYIPKYVTVDGQRKKVTVLGNNFCRSQALDLVSIPNSVRELTDSAFASSKVKRVNIPNSTVTFDNSIFTLCDKLEYIDVDDNNPIIKDIDGVVYSKSGKTIIMYPMAKSGDSYSLNSDVEAIGECAFYGSKIKSISIPSSVKRIKRFAFNKSNIESIVIPNTVQEIRKWLFYKLQKSNVNYYTK